MDDTVDYFVRFPEFHRNIDSQYAVAFHILNPDAANALFQQLVAFFQQSFHSLPYALVVANLKVAAPTSAMMDDKESAGDSFDSGFLPMVL